MTIVRWEPQRQPRVGACAGCLAVPDRQVLPGHDDCLPPIAGRRTIDGHPVAVGLRVWDYDLRPGTVIRLDTHFDGTPDGPLGIVAWHSTSCDAGGEGRFDGGRLWVRHPTTGETVEEAFPPA